MVSDSENIASDGLREAAAASLADVDALGATGDDRKIILEALVQARIVGGITGSARTRQDVDGKAASASLAVNEGDMLTRISAALNVERDVLEAIYSVENNEPILVVSSRRIVQNKAQAARHIALLVASARQVAGLDEWTPVSIIRSVVTDYGRLDSGNFASSLQQLDGVAVLRGKGQQREVKITRQGLESTADLIRTLAGVE